MVEIKCIDLSSAPGSCPADCFDCPLFLNLSECDYETAYRDNC